MNSYHPQDYITNSWVSNASEFYWIYSFKGSTDSNCFQFPFAHEISSTYDVEFYVVKYLKDSRKVLPLGVEQLGARSYICCSYSDIRLSSVCHCSQRSIVAFH
jgi:hypothetical protein